MHGALVVDATTTPDKVPAFTQALSRLMAAQAEGISATDLERAKNQLLVSLVRTAERPLRLLQRCVEQLWTSGSVFDSEPRTISNIIVDQTSTNPAAVCASQFPTRAQGVGAACDLGSVTDVPPYQSLPIDNITTDGCPLRVMMSGSWSSHTRSMVWARLARAVV